jgi:dihydroxy-acid dehydratase
MKKALRSNFEPGTTRWATRRAQWRALGLTDADMEKPKIAVVNSSSELAICFSHLDGVAKRVKEAVAAAGGLPFEIRTVAPSDFIVSAGSVGYILSARDLIVNDMEIAVEGAQLDGMICLTSCDKTPAAHLMAAGRFNIPTIIVICGYQPSGAYAGRHCDIEDVYLGATHKLMGKISAEQLKEMSENAIRGPGVCQGMATANTMHVVCEAIGLALPGSAPVLANSEKMFAYARRAGARIVELVLEDLKPRAILTPAAFHNAVAAVLAVSGSINAVKHLQAAAVESGLDLDVFGLFDRLSRKIPVLSAVRPNGDDTIDAFEQAGGARAVLKQLGELLELDALTVTGKTVRENLSGFTVADAEVIRPVTRAYSYKPPIVILRGSLAPESAIIKLGTGKNRRLSITGPAVVFENGQDATAAIRDGKIMKGDVIVVRGDGPKGQPGMGGSAGMAIFALDALGMSADVGLVTDGQLSGLCNKGLTIAEVSPEAAVGGPLGLVENGDTIIIDVEQRRLDLDVPAEVLKARRERLGNPVLRPSKGYLSLYQKNVQPMSTGAVLLGNKS